MNYYYDDSLVAAYMSREFGVKMRLVYDTTYSTRSENVNFGDAEYENKHRVCFDMPSHWKGYFIHPDSLDVFKPQVGDLYKWIGVGQVDIAIDRCIDNIRDRYSEIEIIQRQGKHFFMPIKEGN